MFIKRGSIVVLVDFINRYANKFILETINSAMMLDKANVLRCC